MSRDSKKNKFANQKQPRRGTYFLIGLAAAAAIVVGAFMLFGKSGSEGLTNVGAVNYGSAAVDFSAVEAEDSGDKIVLDLNEIKNKKSLTFDVQGVNFTLNNGTAFDYLPLLAYVSDKGNIVVAASLCEPCSGVTFHIEGDQLVCNACGTRWSLDGLQGISGGCTTYPPEMIDYNIEGDKLIIDRAVLENWQPRAV